MTSKPIMVITGASSGVGRAAALRFAREGYLVCAIARRENELQTLAAEEPGKIFPYPADITDGQSVQRTFDKILANHQGIEVLINNAGVPVGGRPIDLDLINAVIDTNLKGTLYCTFAALPTMQENGYGHIFNVASIMGVDISPRGNDGLYAASKHGVVAFSESLGKKVRRDGVLVTAICPGGIDTPLWHPDFPYPFERETMIRPEEVADLVAYILSQPRRTLFKNVIFVPVVEQW